MPDFGAQGARKINYRSTGSGDGLRAVTERRADFALTETPLSRAELNRAGLRQFPVFVTPIVVVVNVPGIADQKLRLDAALLAGIYQGKITRWNDPLIVQQNPGLSLPAMEIVPLYRSDSSGSSHIFTQYLSNAVPGWSTTVGTNSNFRPPLERARSARGSSGLAALARNTPGSLTYLSFAAIGESGLATVQMRNAWNRYVVPSGEVFEQTARVVEWERFSLDDDPTYDIDLTNQPGPNSWPIMGATYAVLPMRTLTADNTRDALRFFAWLMDNSDTTVKSMGYTPLPAPMKRRIKFVWRWLFLDAKGKTVAPTNI